jgi:ribonuclease E
MAMVDGQTLFDLNIEGPASERKKANIYKGKITRVEPSLEAAFVDYGADRHGFLPLKEVSSEYFVKEVKSGSKANIRDVLREGQDIVVQIDKEERGNKGAALTTFVSLAGRFIVLKPNKSHSGGVSRRITGGDRDDARQSLNEIEIPDGMSVILRTAGIDRSAEELAWDLENLMSVWQALLGVVTERPSPFLIYRESNSVARALRDYLSNDVGEILIDDEATYNEAVEQVKSLMPHNLKKLKHYVDPVPLFTRFQIESQIESAFSHSVTLPSGGSIVIDHTEALVSIDINSARSTKGGDIEATALNTNVEAAEEIARQLRIRDLGGLIVIDFIDMGPQKNQREVENRLRDSVRQDRARVQIGKITRFGLLEMSRQRLRPSLGESAHQVCPRCSGFGTIRSVESLALAILRIVGEEARKERTSKVIAQLPVEVATYLLNEKRGWVQSLETRNDVQVLLVANSSLETPHYDIRRVRDDQTDLPENAGVSYKLAEKDTDGEIPTSMQERKPAEMAAVATMVPVTPAPARKEPEVEKRPGLIARIIAFFAGDPDDDDNKSKARKQVRHKSGRGRDSQQSRRRGGGNKPQQRSNTRKKTGSKKKTGDSDGRPQQTKKKRPARKKKTTTKAATDDNQTQSQDGEKKPTRSRRSRGGRRRRRPDDRQTQTDTNQNNQADQEAGAPAPAPTPAPAAAKEPAAEVSKPKPARKRRAAAKPKPDSKAESDSKPTTDAAEQQAETRSGPPKARTDAERANDAGEKAPKQAESKPEPKPKPEAKAAPKPEPKPEAKAAPKPEPKAEPKPEPKPEAKSEPKPKPEGRLLPWDE